MKSPVQKFFFNLYPQNIANCICLLESQVENNAFTAWSFANTEYVASAFWADEYSYHKNSVHHPIFDLASLTKPLFINLYLMLKYKPKYFRYINQPLVDLIKNFKITSHSLQKFLENNPTLTLNSFLSHKSGLSPWTWMGFSSTLEITDYILKNKLNNNIEEIYSDLNYFILSRIIESTPNFSWKKVLHKINAILSTNFYHASIEPPPQTIPYFPYKISNEDVNGEKFGYVHDTNGNILSSENRQNKIVSAHAGLFGNIIDIIHVIKYIQANKYLLIFHEEKNKNNCRFIYGFDTPTSVNSTAGIHNFNEHKDKVFGHLGYAGTSFWMHSHLKNFHILLTNRTAKRISTIIHNCPRIYIIENIKTAEKSIYIREKNIVTKSNINEIIGLVGQNHKITWDSRVIPEYQNLLNIRKNIGLNLWGV